MRVAAARQRLAEHHSAPFGGMLRGRGGAKGGGGGRADSDGGFGGVAAACRQLLSAIGGSAPTYMQRGSGQPRGSSRAREGEWACSCGFATNRPHRMACHSCGAERSRAEIGGGSGGGKGKGKGGGIMVQRGDTSGGLRGPRKGGGPVGANGTRPMLGQYAKVQRPDHSGGKEGQGKGGSASTWTGELGKGTTYMHANVGHGALGGKPCGGADAGKGKCEAPQGNNKGAGGMDAGGKGGDGPRTLWVRPPRIVADDGYELVQPQRVRVRIEEQGGQGKGDGRAVGMPGTEERVERKRWAETEDDSDDDLDMEAQDDADESWEEGEDDEGHDGEAAAPDPRVLKAKYEELARAARDLERRGGFAQEGVALKAVRSARDKAEREWREAKVPAPLPTRLGWAEAKVEKAGAALSRIRKELDDFDEWCDQSRAAICKRMEEADAWYRWRQEQRDSLLAEAGEKVPCRGAANGGARGDEVRQSIRSQLLPELQAVMEYADGNPEILERLAMVAAGLVEAESKLGGQEGFSGAEHYDMAQGEPRGGQKGETEGIGGERIQQEEERGPRGGGKGEKEKAAEWKPEGPGRWSRTAAAAAEGKGSDSAKELQQQRQQREGKGADGPGKDGGHPTERETRAGGGRGARCAENGGGEDDDGRDEKPPKQRKKQTEEETREEDRAESDRKRAEELHRQQQEAMAAQMDSYDAGQGGFGSQAALSAVAQKFVLLVQTTQARAEAMGVEPRASDGRTLLELSPEELQEWDKKHLGDKGA